MNPDYLQHPIHVPLRVWTALLAGLCEALLSTHQTLSGPQLADDLETPLTTAIETLIPAEKEMTLQDEEMLRNLAQVFLRHLRNQSKGLPS